MNHDHNYVSAFKCSGANISELWTRNVSNILLLVRGENLQGQLFWRR